MNISETKVLITGVAGLIGSHMADHLLKRGYLVYGLDNLMGGYVENIPEEVNFFVGDITDRKLVERLFIKIKPHFVYHFAAYAAEGLSPFIRNFNYTNNLIGSTNIINACINHNVRKIIFTSSMAVYGKNPPFKESKRPNPIDPYGIAKYAVEMDLHQAHKQFGLDFAIVRPHNVIGVRQNIWDKYRNVIGIWIRRVLNNESILIFGDGQQTRAFSDIEFCLEPMERLMRQYEASTFNLGSDRVYSLNEVAHLLREVAQELGFDPPIEYKEARHEAKEAYCDHTRAKDKLDFRDETDLRKTITDMFGWAIEQENREVKQMPYEIERGMYSYWK